MNCSDTRELLHAFLDSELDAPLSIEIQRHLERCCDCGREAEVERTIRKALVNSLEKAAAAGETDERTLLPDILTSAPDQNQRFRGSWLRRVVWTAAAGLLLGLGAWRTLRQADSSSPASLVPRTLVEDFVGMVADPGKIQLASEDSEAVAHWFWEKLGFDVELPAMRGRCTLVGGRCCTIAGQPAAFALYDMEGSPAALVAVRLDQSGETRGPRAPRGSVARRIDHLEGHTVVSCERNQIAYAAVGPLPAERLLELMPLDCGQRDDDR